MGVFDDLVATGHADGSVRFFDGGTGDTLLCRGHAGPVGAVGVSRDYVLSAGWDGSLRAWAPETVRTHLEA